MNHQDRLQIIKISKASHLMSYGSGLLLRDLDRSIEDQLQDRQFG